MCRSWSVVQAEPQFADDVALYAGTRNAFESVGMSFVSKVWYVMVNWFGLVWITCQVWFGSDVEMTWNLGRMDDDRLLKKLMFGI